MESVARAVARETRRAEIAREARGQADVVSRSQLYAAGVSRSEVRANVKAGRWLRLGSHCIRLTSGPMPREALWWAAVIEGGPRAFLDGETALIAAGPRHYESDLVRVSVPRGARIRHRGTVCNIRQTRRWRPNDVVATGLPRARPGVAAVRAALWARTNRQATLLVTMTAQQKLATVAEMAEALLVVRRDRRRALVQGLLIDLEPGIGSINELDVLHGCRARGIPEPDQQALRRTPGGTYFLDFRWNRYSVVLEVDGIQHGWVQHTVSDALRHNAIAMTGDVVLRLPVLGLRLCPDTFFDQLVSALEAAGWRGRHRPSA